MRREGDFGIEGNISLKLFGAKFSINLPCFAKTQGSEEKKTPFISSIGTHQLRMILDFAHLPQTSKKDRQINGVYCLPCLSH